MVTYLIHFLIAAACSAWFAAIEFNGERFIHKSRKLARFGMRAIAFIPAVWIAILYLDRYVHSGWGLTAFVVGGFASYEALRVLMKRSPG